MLKMLWRARALAPALLLPLMGCDNSEAEARYRARQAAVDPSQLWLAEALDAGGRPIDAVYVCADLGLREGFARASARVNGAPCNPERNAVDRPDLYAVRCEAGSRRFGLTVNRTGDLQRDFTVRVAVQAVDGLEGGGGHVRRYRMTGACPKGWTIGDQAKPGKPPHANALGAPAGASTPST